MMTALIAIGYIIAGMLVGRISYIKIEKADIENRMQVQRTWDEKRGNVNYSRRMTEDARFEVAYKESKDRGLPKFFSVLFAMWWPMVATIFLGRVIAVGGYKAVAALFPKSPADKKFEEICNKRERIKQWNNAIKQLEAAGLDTKEMRKMQFD